MLKIGENRDISIVVVLAITLHLVWAILIQIDPNALNATALAAVYKLFPSPALVSISLFTVALLAGIGVFTRFPWVVLLLLPQEAMLCASAAGALKAMYIGQFADGVPRPHLFIAADQLNCLLLAAAHTVAIIAHARRTIR